MSTDDSVPVVDRTAWLAARAALLEREKALTRACDALAAERRRLPRERMGWSFPWVSSADDFDADHGITGGFGVNVFLSEGGEIFRTWNTCGRGVETLGTVWTLLDVTPLGRQETWEAPPSATPRTPAYEWWRLHDEYDR